MNSQIRILGVDPGVAGALALFLPEDPARIVTADTPVVAKELDVDTLIAILRELAPTFAVIERVASMPKQGVASTFKFGTAYGAARAAVAALGIPHVLVTPTKWKSHFNLSSDGEVSRALALRLWPAAGCFTRKRDHNRAEAALLARYGWEVALKSSDRLPGGGTTEGGGVAASAPPSTSSPRAIGVPA